MRIFTRIKIIFNLVIKCQRKWPKILFVRCLFQRPKATAVESIDQLHNEKIKGVN